MADDLAPGRESTGLALHRLLQSVGEALRQVHSTRYGDHPNRDLTRAANRHKRGDGHHIAVSPFSRQNDLALIDTQHR